MSTEIFTPDDELAALMAELDMDAQAMMEEAKKHEANSAPAANTPASSAAPANDAAVIDASLEELEAGLSEVSAAAPQKKPEPVIDETLLDVVAGVAAVEQDAANAAAAEMEAARQAAQAKAAQGGNPWAAAAAKARAKVNATPDDDDPVAALEAQERTAAAKAAEEARAAEAKARDEAARLRIAEQNAKRFQEEEAERIAAEQAEAEAKAKAAAAQAAAEEKAAQERAAAEAKAKAEAIARAKAAADAEQAAAAAVPRPTADTPASASAGKLRFGIDVEQFQRDTRVTEATLDNCMIEQASTRAFYGAQAAQAEAQASRMKARFEVIEATLYDRHRKALAKAEEKVTEKMVDCAVKQDPNWLKAKNMMIEAETIAAMNKSMVDSLRDRKDMLVQLGADRREGMKGQLRILSEQGDRESIADRAANAAREAMGLNKKTA